MSAKATILIVDDEPDVRDVLLEYFVSHGYAVMGAEQASDTLFTILQRNMQSNKSTLTPEELNQLRETVKNNYKEQTDIRYGAARGWVDAIIPPHETREVLMTALRLVMRKPVQTNFKTGVLQV